MKFLPIPRRIIQPSILAPEYWPPFHCVLHGTPVSGWSFFGDARHEAAAHAEESKPIITVPLMVLAGLSLLGGALNLPFEGFHNLGHWLEYTLHEVESLPLNYQVAGISTVLALLAILISWFIYGRNPLKTGPPDPLKRPLGFLFTVMENKWFVDEIYQAIIITTLRSSPNSLRM